MVRSMRGRTLARGLAAVVLGLLAACGGGGGGGGGGSTPSPVPTGDDVVDTLTNLGISTSATPRLDGNSNPLPASYSPLGKKRTLIRKSEIFLAGAPLATAPERVNMLKFEPAGTSTPDRTVQMPANALDESWKSSPYNAAAACDVDGDGREETALLWWSSSDNRIRLRFIGDQDAAFAASTDSVLDTVTTPSQLRIACADFDGDGKDEPIVGVANDTAGTVTLDVLSGSRSAGYRADAALRKTYATPQAGARLGIELAAGRLDHDSGAELGVVVNAIWNLSCSTCRPTDGRSDYYLYDDRGTRFALLRSGRISAAIGAVTHDGKSGNIAIGDIDGNGLDDVVLASLTAFPSQCQAVTSLQMALGDATAGFRSLGTKVISKSIQNCNPNDNGGQGYVEHLWVNTLDVDGDQVKEIAVNTEFYEDFKNAAAPWDPLMVQTGGAQAVAATIPQNYFYHSGSNLFAQVTRDYAAMAVGDVNGDNKEDLLLFHAALVPASGGLRLAMTVWGLDPLTGFWGKTPSPNGTANPMGLLYLEELVSAGQRLPGPPIVASVNVDRDSTLLLFEEGSHRVVFSEPIVHAALAAPPCWGDGSQVSDDCRTSWGTGSSSGTNASISHEVTARVHRGVSGNISLPIVGELGVDFEQSVGLSVKAEASLGYELTRTVTYTTGPMEDTVVATVIPYDQYSYRILSHPVHPELVGQDLIVSLPRTPRTIQINRRFYNDSLVGAGPRIDDSIFSHTIGNPKSYPTRSQMLARSGAKRIGPQSVGASSGNQSVEISESLVGGLTATLGLSYETSVKTTGGKVMAGFTVGSTTEASLGFTVGSQVTFAGTVGDMPPPTFSLDKAYSFGMFVYQQAPGGTQQPMQVINYWVE